MDRRRLGGEHDYRQDHEPAVGELLGPQAQAATGC